MASGITRKQAEKRIKEWLKVVQPVDEITGKCPHDHLKFRDATRMYLDCTAPGCQRSFYAGTKRMMSIPDFSAMNEASGVNPERTNPFAPRKQAGEIETLFHPITKEKKSRR